MFAPHSTFTARPEDRRQPLGLRLWEGSPCGLELKTLVCQSSDST